jgi:hypothetical protein
VRQPTPGSWKPGKSGNPGGRIKGAERIARDAAEARSYTDAEGNTHTGLSALVACLIDIAFDKNEAARDRIVAASSAADRGWGKPKQAIEVTSTEQPTETRPASEMTDEEISQALDAIDTLKRLGAVAADDDAPAAH